MTDLKVSGHVYLEKPASETTDLVDLSDALVAVERGWFCPRRGFDEAESYPLDIHVTRTDSNGIYHLPTARVSVRARCKTYLRATVFVPFLRSEVGYFLNQSGIQWSARYRTLADEDVVARPAANAWAKPMTGARELFFYLRPFDELPGPEKRSVFLAMRPEICRTLAGEPVPPPGPPNSGPKLPDPHPSVWLKDLASGPLTADEISCE